MLRHRIIPVLLVQQSALVKSTRFLDHKYIGDPINAVRIFNDLKADELFLLDIDASKDNGLISADLVRDANGEAFMPLSVGGGISSLADIEELLRAGAEKVLINTYAARNPAFIKEASRVFGSTAIVVCMDVREMATGNHRVCVSGGREATEFRPVEYARLIESSGAGELVVQSIDRDGAMSGYDIELVRSVSQSVGIPVVALGGAGNESDLEDAIKVGGANAAGAGSLFVFHGKNRGVLLNYPNRGTSSSITYPSRERKEPDRSSGLNRYRRCLRCVMDTTDPEITFDRSGYCNHCTEFIATRGKYSYQGRQSDRKLERTIEEIKRAGRGNRYDCVIGISGGIDSSFCLHMAAEKGLRVLAVHMDNGWDSKDALHNIKSLTSKLEVDYDSYVLDWNEFRDLQLSFLKASVPEAETPTDIAIVSTIFDFAARFNVKYIISGGNLVTEGILPRSWHYNAKDLRYLRHISKEFGGRSFEKIPTFDYKKELYFKMIKGVRIVYPLNDMPYTPEYAFEVLKSNYNWIDYGGKHHESNYTKFIQSYYLYTKFGIDYRRARLSSEICTGRITRNEACDILQSIPFNTTTIEDEKLFIAKKLGVTRDQLGAILNRPPKWYWDYPNDARKLRFMYDFYRKLLGRARLASS